MPGYRYVIDCARCGGTGDEPNTGAYLACVECEGLGVVECSEDPSDEIETDRLMEREAFGEAP